MSLWIQNITACPVRTLVRLLLPLPLCASYDSPSVCAPRAPGFHPSAVSALCDRSLAPLFESAGTKCDTGWGLRPMVTMETV